MRTFSFFLAVLTITGFLLAPVGTLYAQGTAKTDPTAEPKSVTRQFTSAAEPKPDARLQIPPMSAQAESRKLVLSLYGDDIAKAKKPEEKVALAKKLLQTATETKDDPAGQYVLLGFACDLAVKAKDADLALSIVDEITKRFAVDDLTIKVDVLTKLLAEARSTNDSNLVNQVTAQITEIKETQAEFAKIKAAVAVLDKNPTDPAANLAVGKFYCFFKGDWEKGLPMLALGNDAGLKKLADQELAKPSESAKQAELADGWWGVGEKLTGLAQQRVGSHSAELYRVTLPELSGLVKAKAEKRVEQIEEMGKKRLAEVEIPLTTLKPVSHSVGWNELGINVCPPQKDKKPVIDGSEINQFIFAHAPSNVRYELPAGIRTFSATGTTLSKSSHFRFVVKCDSKVVYESQPLSSYRKNYVKIKVPLPAGAKELELVVDDMGNNSWCWSVWCLPVLSR